MPKKRYNLRIDPALIDMIDSNVKKLPYYVPRTVIIERAIAYYYGCLEDFVRKEGKFANGKICTNPTRNSQKN